MGRTYYFEPFRPPVINTSFEPPPPVLYSPVLLRAAANTRFDVRKTYPPEHILRRELDQTRQWRQVTDEERGSARGFGRKQAKSCALVLRKNGDRGFEPKPKPPPAQAHRLPPWALWLWVVICIHAGVPWSYTRLILAPFFAFIIVHEVCKFLRPWDMMYASFTSIAV